MRAEGPWQQPGSSRGWYFKCGVVCVCDLLFDIPLYAAQTGYDSGSAAAEAVVVGFSIYHYPLRPDRPDRS